MVPKSETNPAKRLEIILNKLGLEVIPEYPVGPYFIDCYCPEIGVGFEFDGPWHKLMKSRDKKRSNWIEEEKNIKILRITQKSLNIKSVKELLGL